MGAKRPDVLMILLVILTVWGSAEADCSSSCSSTSCDCSSRRLSSVPQDLPTNITTLDLTRNNITILSQSDFSRYRSLESLDIDSNPISTINSQAFYFLSHLTFLSLIGNQITTLRADMFTGLGNMQNIYLSENEISDIPAGTFSPTPQLRFLRMSHNNVTKVRADMFTGLGNLEILWQDNNEISDIQAGTFSSTPQLRYLHLEQNKLTNLRSGMFTGLGNLWYLWLHSNEINVIQAGTFSSTPQLRYLHLEQNKLTNLRSGMFTGLGNLDELYLQRNRLTTLSSAEYDILSSISEVSIYNNPWQCDCRMVPFRLKMNGSQSFENQINCAQPDHLYGLNLKNINLEYLLSVCVEPTIVRFQISDYTSVQGETFHLVCEASGIPTPDITVILPSGQNATVESDGRVTVNGTIIVKNVTTADSGLYVCTAASLVGSTFATLVVDLVPVPTAVSSLVPVPTAVSSLVPVYTAVSSLVPVPTAVSSLVPVYTAVSSLVPVPTTASSLVPSFPLSALLGAIFGSIAGTLLVVAIVLTIWRRRNNNSPSERPDHAVVFKNTNTTAVITIDQTDQIFPQGSLNPEHRPKSAAPLPHEYETVLPHPDNARPRSADPRLTSLNDAYRNSDERPPLPFPRGADGDDSAAQYQSLRKTDADHESADDYETPHDYVYVTE